jgi:hypothetical protein
LDEKKNKTKIKLGENETVFRRQTTQNIRYKTQHRYIVFKSKSYSRRGGRPQGNRQKNGTAGKHVGGRREKIFVCGPRDRCPKTEGRWRESLGRPGRRKYGIIEGAGHRRERCANADY